MELEEGCAVLVYEQNVLLGCREGLYSWQVSGELERVQIDVKDILAL